MLEYAEPQSVDEMMERYAGVHARCYRPAHAVEDDGIDLSRPRKGWTQIVKRKPIVMIEPKVKAVPLPPREDANAHVVAFYRKRIADMEGVEYRASAEEIARDILSASPYTITDARSDRRTADLVNWRFAIMYALRAETGLSYPQIGRFLGKRDHTSVLHGCQVMERAIASGQVTQGITPMGRVFWLRRNWRGRGRNSR